MDKRRELMATVAVFVASVAGCRAQIVDLGGPNACAVDGGSPASCGYSGSYSDGSGHFDGLPPYCADPDGAQIQPASTAQVAAALVGVWAACASSGPYPGSEAIGVEFGADGKFFLLDGDTDDNLKPASDVSRQGTFMVVDATASLGAGEFQVRFAAGNGGVSLAQVTLFGSPARLRFFVPAAADFVPAETWGFRAGVCGPAFGPQATCSDEDLLSRMQGRWIWCGSGRSGPPLSGADIGLEVRGATWSALIEDGRGAVVPAPGESGNVTLGSDGTNGATWTRGGITIFSPWRPLIDACGREMLLSPDHVCQVGQALPCSVDYSASVLFVRSP
jgi:hypothetical protein